jgi:hypothetical protein
MATPTCLNVTVYRPCLSWKGMYFLDIQAASSPRRTAMAGRSVPIHSYSDKWQVDKSIWRGVTRTWVCWCGPETGQFWMQGGEGAGQQLVIKMRTNGFRSSSVGNAMGWMRRLSNNSLRLIRNQRAPVGHQPVTSSLTALHLTLLLFRVTSQFRLFPHIPIGLPTSLALWTLLPVQLHILNTLRTGDANLRFCITNVKDEWRKSAFLTRALFPCTSLHNAWSVSPDGPPGRMFKETWPHSELMIYVTYRGKKYPSSMC